MAASALLLTLIVSIVSIVAAQAASNGSVCTILGNEYGSATLFPTSANYTAQVTDYWDIRSSGLHPSCIFSPTSADQVARAVQLCHAHDTYFAVRGGGHMNHPGSNNIDSGVLIALNAMTKLEVSDDHTQIEVGPGNRWIDVYEALSEFDRYAIGGRLKTIGVSGLSLIGGFHYFNNKYEFAMDNVLSYDVVLGNGTQLTANRTCNPELFWALKGGANNFAIVIKFTLKTFEAPQISTTTQQFNESAVRQFIDAVANLAEDSDPSIAAGAVITITYNATDDSVAPLLLGVQEGGESPPSRFANFSAIDGTYKVDKVMKPIEWHSTLDSPFQMFRVQFGHHTMRPDADQMYKMYLIWRAAVSEIRDIALYPTMVFNLLPPNAATVAKTNGVGNVWGLDGSSPLILWQFSTSWAKATDDIRITGWTKNTIAYIHSLNKAKCLASEFLYMGDAGEFQTPFSGMPVENVQRMMSVREAYDPNGVFTRLNWGGFKLGA